MKKLLLAAVMGIALSSYVKAQNASTVIRTEPQVSDIFEVLKTMNINMFCFDLSAYLNDIYTVKLYIDEYEDGKKVKEAGSSQLGKNIESLNDLREEIRDGFRKLKQVPEGKDEWDNIKELSLYITKPNDSTAMFTINIPGVLKTNKRVQLHPVSEQKLYLYDSRPFKFNEATQKDSINIPLVMYGSYWVDTKYNVIRMCGEKEIDPEMKAKILQNLPHYFVVGLELRKETN